MMNRTPLPRIAAMVAALALVGAACGSDAPTAEGPATVDEPATTVVDSTTSVPADVATGGWIDGEPDWTADQSIGSSRELAAVDADVAFSDAEAPPKEGPIPVEPDGGIGDSAEPIPFEDAPINPIEPPIDPPIDRPVDDTPLRAGSVDDNADFAGFLAYLERIAGLGVVTRDLDPTGRTIITVVDEAGNPVPGAVVEASSDSLTPDGTPIALRTTADGTVRFHPGFYGDTTDGVVQFGLGVADAELIPASAGENITIVAPAAVVGSPVPLDVLFLLDATGSMGDEIDRLKQTIDVVAERVAALDPAPDVRFAMTLYRDEGDAFVTANYDFTGDIVEFQRALADVVADGGGDYPEALDEGLADALAKPSWRDPSDAVQLVFVVADAPPQVGRQVTTPYTDSVRSAIERGIKIFPVASSESDDQAEAVFRQMAQATGAPFVFLSKGAGGAATGESTDITTTDYEELALDELVVRLIAEELTALGSTTPVTVPTTVAPPTTNPDGQ